MTSISTLGNSSAGRADSNESSRSCSSRKSASLGQFLKTAAVLGLALTGGAQARGPGSSPIHYRDLKNGYAPANPFKYDSLCNEPGMLDKLQAGLNYEDCLVEEHAAIHEKKDGKSLKVSKMCAIVSGSILAVFSATGVLSLIKRTELSKGIASMSCLAGGLAILPTSVCAGSYLYGMDELELTRDEAEKCCEFFPKKAQVEAAEVANTAKADNSILASNTTAEPGLLINLISNQTVNTPAAETLVGNATFTKLKQP